MDELAWPEGLFTCPVCGRDRPARSFYRSRFASPSTPRLVCRECHRGRMLDRLERLLDEIKLERGCEDRRCVGHPTVAVALDFDHRPGTGKAFSVAGKVPSWSYDTWYQRTMAVIAKCDVVCANCHRVRTAERDGGARDRDLHPSGS